MAARRLSSVTLPITAGGPGPLVTTFTYDQDGELLSTQQSSGGTILRTVAASYTPTGNVATATDAKGNVTRFAYDAVDRVASVAGSGDTYHFINIAMLWSEPPG